jgi:hypothetical protein
LEQGPKKQPDLSVCWGGVSSAIGFYDLDADYFVPSRHKVCLEYHRPQKNGKKTKKSIKHRISKHFNKIAERTQLSGKV